MTARYTVSLVKQQSQCPFWKCRATGRAVTEQHATRGWTVYRFTHTALCPSRLFGTDVPRGLPFAPGEYLTDRRGVA